MKRKIFHRNRVVVPNRDEDPEIGGKIDQDFPIRKLLIPLLILAILFLICAVLLAQIKVREKQNDSFINSEQPPKNTPLIKAAERH